MEKVTVQASTTPPDQLTRSLNHPDSLYLKTSYVGERSTVRQRILVVEDNPDIQALVVDVLADEGYEVNVVSNGKTALEVVTTYHPTLILLDLCMPIMDGWSFLHRYHQQSGAMSPVIVMSAAGTRGFDWTVLRFVKGFLPKPFRINDLLRCIQDNQRDASQ